MQLTNQTILITGGTSGIGLELARQLLALGNTVIITGRNAARLAETQAALPGVIGIQSDVSDPTAIKALAEQLRREHPALNVLINNAGIMRKINLQADNELADLTQEIETNLTGAIQMVQALLPQLKSRPEALIVNVTSGLAFIPFGISPIYSATKAGLHAYTQTLRMQLANTRVCVVELAPPGTETPLFRGDFSDADLAGVKGMPVATLAEQAIKGLQKGREEIRPGLSNVLKLMSRIAPTFMMRQLGKSVRLMHKQ